MNNIPNIANLSVPLKSSKKALVSFITSSIVRSFETSSIVNCLPSFGVNLLSDKTRYLSKNALSSGSNSPSQLAKKTPILAQRLFNSIWRLYTTLH